MATGRGTNALERGTGGGGDSFGTGRVFHRRARYGGGLGVRVSRRPVGSPDVRVAGAESVGVRRSGLSAIARSGSRDFLSVGDRPVRTRGHHPDIQLKLRRQGIDLRRFDHRHSDPGRAAASASLGDH